MKSFDVCCAMWFDLKTISWLSSGVILKNLKEKPNLKTNEYPEGFVSVGVTDIFSILKASKLM